MSETYVVNYTNRQYVGTRMEVGPTARAKVIEAIVYGEIDGEVESVHCYDPDEGWSRDISEDMAREVAGKVMDGNYPPIPEVRDFIEGKLGVGTAIPAAA